MLQNICCANANMPNWTIPSLDHYFYKTKVSIREFVDY